jgi:hypothetical protein
MLVGCVEGAPAAQDFALGEPEARRRDDGRYDVAFRDLPPRRHDRLRPCFDGQKPYNQGMDSSFVSTLGGSPLATVRQCIENQERT